LVEHTIADRNVNTISSYICAEVSGTDRCVFITSAIDTYRGFCWAETQTIEAFHVPTTYDSGVTISEQTMYAPLIRLLWHSSDLPIASDSNTAPSTSETGQSNGDESRGGGLSPGATAGVTIGGVVGVLCLFGVAILYYRRSKNLSLMHRSSMNQPPPYQPKRFQFSGGRATAAEVQEQVAFEMSGQQSWAHELPHEERDRNGPVH
jgi:hypothetical protein